jgi:hypothetical protein
MVDMGGLRVRLGVLATCTILVGVLPFPVNQANAVACNSGTYAAFEGSAWQPADHTVAGVRAPVQLRRDGLACGTAGNGAVSTWIAIQQGGSGVGIAQIGYAHFYDPVNGQRYCRFWATGDGTNGQSHMNSCTDSNGYRFFKIVRFWDNVSKVYRYEISDCGTSGYGTCTTKDANQISFGWEEGAATEEAWHACQDQLMGSTANRVNIGTSTNALQYIGDYGGTWDKRDIFKVESSTCAAYDATISNNEVVLISDGRN